MCGSILWGTLLIIFGVSILINAVFGINLPIFKILFAGFLIYFGIKIITGLSTSNSCKERCSVVFDTRTVEATLDQDKYWINFSNSAIDLRLLASITTPKKVIIKTNFATTTVRLPKNLPIHIKVKPTFSTVELPNGQKHTCSVDGDYEYKNLYQAEAPLLKVIINSTFSNIIIQE